MAPLRWNISSGFLNKSAQTRSCFTVFILILFFIRSCGSLEPTPGSVALGDEGEWLAGSSSSSSVLLSGSFSTRRPRLQFCPQTPWTLMRRQVPKWQDVYTITARWTPLCPHQTALLAGIIWMKARWLTHGGMGWGWAVSAPSSRKVTDSFSWNHRSTSLQYSILCSWFQITLV